MTPDVHRVAAEALEAITAAQDLAALDAVRTRYLGRGDGELTGYRRGLGKIADKEARRQMGQMVNELVERVTDALDERQRTIERAARARSMEAEALDLTRPAPPLRRGRLSPVTLAAREIRRIFGQLGFEAVEGPEVEYDRYNFTLVNQPPGHPARDSQDTFYIDDSRLLRTHTSPVQIRSMLIRGAPQRVIVPGKTYRRDHDATHMPMFHQVEALCIDEGIAVSDLKGSLEFFARSFFGAKSALQWRPHHFPFTEPSLELELACVVCHGSGCSVCKYSGWLELLGSGMVHPQVLRNGGVDPERYSGFAFGMGIERAAMLAWGIPDMRLLYDNDVRFLVPEAGDRQPGCGDMRFSLRWLRDYATLDAPVAAIVKALVDTGTEVGAVEIGGEGIVVARITAVSPVPGSSHLQFADLDLGGDVPESLAAFSVEPGTVRVMTGAPNVKAGDLVPYAPPGTRPPAMDERLGVRTIRGHKSPGMLCSAIELGVGEDADGILILEDGTPGQALVEALPMDTVLDLDITTNRPDCLCHVGIARELAAALGEAFTEPPASVPDALLSATSAELRAQVRIEDPEGCPRFSARVIEGVVVGPSPAWLRQRLRSVGLRPINNVVDVTNFVLHELGEPLHAFDLERFVEVGGARVADVVVRRAAAGEHVVDLLGADRELSADDLVVCAGATPASISGVIGGLATAVTDSTRTVLLEAASWDGPSIRATSKRLGLRTDASTLFEKGLSDRLPPVALDRAASLIAEISGGHVLGGFVEQWPRPLPELGPIDLTARFAGDLLGIPIDATEIATTLARLGFAVEQDGGTLTVVPPYFRRDVSLREDLVEEVGRMIGYSRVPSTLPGRRVAVTTTASHAPIEDSIRDTCVGAGFDEAITFAFVAAGDATLLPGLGGSRKPIALRNPLSDEWSVMRTSQLPRLCGALAANVNRGSADVMLFELGRAFWEGDRVGLAPGSTSDGSDANLPPLPLEPLLLSLAVHVSSGTPDDAADAVRRIQAVFERLTADLAGAPLRAVPGEEKGLHPGRSATLRYNGATVGLLGELDFETTAAFEIRGRVAVGELRIDAIAPSPPMPVRFAQPPRFPAIVQDLAVTVPADRLAGDAIDAIHEAEEPLLEHAELYDEYRGGSLGAGRKGWTFRLTFRAADRTLTGEEAQRAQDTIAAALAKRCDAEIRR